MKILQVKVKPRAHSSKFEAGDDGVWRASLKSPPVDGKANEELLALVAKHFACPRAAVKIKSGASGRIKRVQLDVD